MASPLHAKPAEEASNKHYQRSPHKRYAEDIGNGCTNTGADDGTHKWAVFIGTCFDFGCVDSTQEDAK